MSTVPHNIIPLRPEVDQRRISTYREIPPRPDWLTLGETVWAILAVVVVGAVVVSAMWVWL